jgi:Tfp pilus assembly protein FimT
MINFLHYERRGFSMVELLVVFALAILLGIIMVPNLSSWRNRTDFDSTVRQIATILREAQSRSMAQASSTSWGVRFENSTTTAPFYALFATSYGAGTTIGYYRLPVSVRYSTSSLAQGSSINITFAQITGLPSATTSIMLELTAGSRQIATSTITVSANGSINY